MAVIFGPQAVTIQGGVRETAAAEIPNGASRVDLTLTRENWPVGGILLGFMLSYDGGNGYEMVNNVGIAPGVATPKAPGVIPPAKLGFGWSTRIPTHAKIRTDNLAGNFTSTATIEVF